MKLTIHSGGAIRFIYADALVPLLALGTATVERASHVEPAPMPDGSIGWSATIIADGEVLGPFPTRAEALAAEVAYLEASVL